MVMSNTCSIVDGLKPILVMVVVQFGFVGVNVFYKLAADDGMNLRILVVYRFLFAVAFIVPFAFFLERKRRPKLTWTVVGQAFLCGLLGGSLVQNLYLESLALTSATFVSAMGNLVPAVTFTLAVSFRYKTHRDGRKAVTNSKKSGKLVVEFFKRVHVICLQLDLASGASPFPSQNLGTSINFIGANGTSALCFLEGMGITYGFPVICHGWPRIIWHASNRMTTQSTLATQGISCQLLSQFLRKVQGC